MLDEREFPPPDEEEAVRAAANSIARASADGPGVPEEAARKLTITYDRYGQLMPGNEAQAADLLDAYLVGAQKAPQGAQA